MSIMISSQHTLECEDPEKAAIGAFLEAELDNIDLWVFNFNILSLHPHICDTNNNTNTNNNNNSRQRRKQRRQLQQQRLYHNNLTTTTTATASVLEDEQEKQRRLELAANFFHIFFRGGGKCFFCDEDDDDDGRRRRNLEHNDDEEEEEEEEEEYNEFLADDNYLRGKRDTTTTMSTNLKSSSSSSRSTNFTELWETLEALEEKAEAIYQKLPPTEPNENGNLYEHEQDDHNYEGRQSGRRRMSCGGCKTLDFERDGDGHILSGTPYIDKKEYWDSHGVEIKAIPRSGTGYAPDKQGRIYDTSYYALNDYYGDPDLGSPNIDCGGHGLGSGGRRHIWNTNTNNPGANCVAQGNILIIQESNKPYADDNLYGGRIVFRFRYNVTLQQVGFMDIVENSGYYCKITMNDGTVHRHEIVGYGKNSLSTMEFDMEHVTKLEVHLLGPGAIRFVAFCHDCGERDQERTTGVQNYYPPSTVRSYENQHTVQDVSDRFPSVVLYLESILRIQLWSEFVHDTDSCLYLKYPNIQVRMLASTPVAANNCHLL